MALSTASITLPTNVVMQTIEGVNNASTVASLSTAAPQIFANTEHLYFSKAVEAEVVGEAAAKSASDPTVAQVPAKLVKVQTTTRVSEELRWADEDNRIAIIEAIQRDQSKAIARAIDYVIYHAIQPTTGAALGTGYTALTAMTGVNTVTSASDALTDWDALVAAVNADYLPTGVALSRTFAADMRAYRDNSGARIWPEIPVGLNVSNVEGLAAAVSNTVNGALATTPTKVLAIMGDFDLIKWGMVREMQAEVIEFGDPDGAGDLKRYNQVAYRTEACFAYAVLDAAGFAVLKSA